MSEIDIQGDEALVKLLLNADKGDIDLLIDYVTNTGKFGVSMSDSVKAVLLDTKLHDVADDETMRRLVRELQHFGGNTFVNLMAEQSNTTHANKVLLRKWSATSLMQQKIAIEETQLSFGRFQQALMSEQPQSARLLVEMQDGKPVKCFELPAV